MSLDLQDVLSFIKNATNSELHSVKMAVSDKFPSYDPVEWLPLLILEKLLGFLDLEDVISCSHVNTKWKTYLESHRIWHKLVHQNGRNFLSQVPSTNYSDPMWRETALNIQTFYKRLTEQEGRFKEMELTNEIDKSERVLSLKTVGGLICIDYANKVVVYDTLQCRYLWRVEKDTTTKLIGFSHDETMHIRKQDNVGTAILADRSFIEMNHYNGRDNVDTMHPNIICADAKDVILATVGTDNYLEIFDYKNDLRLVRMQFEETVREVFALGVKYDTHLVIVKCETAWYSVRWSSSEPTDRKTYINELRQLNPMKTAQFLERVDLKKYGSFLTIGKENMDFFKITNDMTLRLNKSNGTISVFTVKNECQVILVYDAFSLETVHNIIETNMTHLHAAGRRFALVKIRNPDGIVKLSLYDFKKEKSFPIASDDPNLILSRFKSFPYNCKWLDYVPPMTSKVEELICYYSDEEYADKYCLQHEIISATLINNDIHVVVLIPDMSRKEETN